MASSAACVTGRLVAVAHVCSTRESALDVALLSLSGCLRFWAIDVMDNFHVRIFCPFRFFRPFSLCPLFFHIPCYSNFIFRPSNSNLSLQRASWCVACRLLQAIQAGLAALVQLHDRLLRDLPVLKDPVLQSLDRINIDRQLLDQEVRSEMRKGAARLRATRCVHQRLVSRGLHWYRQSYTH